MPMGEPTNTPSAEESLAKFAEALAASERHLAEVDFLLRKQQDT